ncbi:MAG: maleylpyruvate isomerase family mycothiol-dependent enzyme, partial [Dehalococcoidia bacterium]
VTARLMETWSHGLDIVDVVNAERPDTDRLRHVATLGIRTRAFSYVNRGLEPPHVPVYVELTAPSGAIWTFGEKGAPDRITGSASDFCRVVTQRRHLADTALVIVGEAAQEWMHVAQAFAGPPGPGRQPGEFGHDEKDGPDD